MRTTTASALRSRLGDYLNQKDPVVVTQKGRPKAVLIPLVNEDGLERLLMANSAERMKLLDEADRRISKTGGTSHDEFWAQVNGKAQARARPSRTRKRGPARGQDASS